MAQRVLRAEVAVQGRAAVAIGRGLCVFAAVGQGDGAADVTYLADKLAHLRVFPGVDSGRMTASLLQAGGEMLLIPQFTLYGDVRRGRRPDFGAAAPPGEGAALLEALAVALRGHGVPLRQGIFGADMLVAVDGDGPVTILLDSRRAF